MSDIPHPKKKWVPPAQTASGSVDNGVLEKVGTLLKEESLNEISQFLSKGFGNQLLQSWSYFAQVNDHRKFTTSTISLSKLLGFISNNDELQEYGVQLVKDILTSYIKTIYRGLNSMRASLTNPIIRLLNEIVIFKNGALIDDFVALFDFTLPVLPKLLNPSKSELSNIEGTKEKEHLSMRYCFIRFLLNLLKYSAPLLRKDLLLSNSKIMINWFKHICTIDSDGLIGLTISVWDEKIIKEQSFKKATKIKVFNEWNLSKLLPIYYTKDKELRSVFDKFILSLATDSKYGLRFNDDEAWFLQTSGSGTISVNGRSFKTHNKLLYGLITNLKPWDDDLQLNTTIQILKASPEMIPPFMNYLASRGLHDPKLSSYWLGQTLLLSKVICLDIPADIESHDAMVPPSTNIIIELVVPCVLNRAVLARCFISDSFLIRQLSSQLIINSILKLEQIISLYSKKGWDEAKIQLLNKVRLSLPEISTVLNSLTDSYNKKSENKILLLTLLSVVNGYMKLFSESLNFSQQLSKPYSDIINEKQFKSIDFVLLDRFFQLQEGDSTQLKWWNKTDKSISLFTSLLKLASSNDSTNSAVSAKITNILCGIVKQTVVFNNEEAKVNQIELLVHSLQLVTSNGGIDNPQIEKIWKLLDESVSRCVRAPFKYLDSSKDLQRISPLLVTIFEQWKFVDKETPYDLTSKWFAIFLRLLVIAGEPISAIEKLLEGVDLDCSIFDYLPSGSYEENLQKLQNDPILKVEPNSSFFDSITTATLNKIQNNVKLPTSHLDLVGALFRVLQISNDNTLKLNQRGLEKIIVDILSKVGNYLIGNTEATKEFSNKKYWLPLFVTEEQNDKTAFISCTLAEIFSQLPEFNNFDFKAVINELLEKKTSSDEDSVIAACLWALDDSTLLKLLENDSLLLKQEALSLLSKRKVSLSSINIASLAQEPALLPLVEHVVSLNLVAFDNLEPLFTTLSSDHSRFSLFNLLSQNLDIIPQLLEFVILKDDPVLTCYVCSSLSAAAVSSIDNGTFTKLIEVAELYAIEHIKKEDYEIISFPQLLNIFVRSTSNIDAEVQQLILSYALTKYNNKYIQQIAEIIERFNCFQDDLVKVWINKSILFMTKVFSEVKQLPASFIAFLKSFKSLLSKSGSIQVANKSNLNTLLEAIFTRWVADETPLEFAAMIIVVASKASLETTKLLQIFIANDDIAFLNENHVTSRSRFLSALILWRLFEFDVSKNSSLSLQEKILMFYNGTNNAEDQLLYKILEKIETRLNSSWVDLVYTWDFLDSLTEEETELIGEAKFIEKKKEGFIVTLSKTKITSTIENYCISNFEVPSLNSSGFGNWNKIQSFYEEVESAVSKKDSYNPLFLSLLIINNEELMTSSTDVEDQSPKVNMRKLVESELFAFILMNLSSQDKNLIQVTLNILSALLHSLQGDSSFKDKHIFELFLSKVVYTFKKTSELGERTNPQEFSPLIYSMISKLSIVLNNPGHFLYEKAFRWILKSPAIRKNEIPLFNEISTVLVTNDDASNYYKQLVWLIEGFVTGVKNKDDVNLLRNKNVFEWILNLESSPYITSQLKFLILDFIKSVQDVEDGADMLVTRYGGLANIEQQLSVDEHNGELITINNELVKNKQEVLNLKELGLRYSIIGQNKKRITNWTHDDVIQGFTKRLHK